MTSQMPTSMRGEAVVVETAPPQTTGRVLVVDDDEMLRELVRAALSAEGLTVTTARNGVEALELLDRSLPDLVVCDVNMPGMDGFTLLRLLREQPAGRSVPLMFLTSRGEAQDAITGLRLGADDYLRKPFELPELVARVRAKLDRPPVPMAERGRDVRTGLLSESQFLHEVAREQGRAERSGRRGVVAVMDLDERAVIVERFGGAAGDELTRQLAVVVGTDARELELVGQDSAGRFLLLVPEGEPGPVNRALLALAAQVVRQHFTVVGEPVSVTPVIGWTGLGPGSDKEEMPNADGIVARAALAAEACRANLDLQPVQWTPQLGPLVAAQSKARRLERLRERTRTPGQIVATFVLGVVLPFLLLVGLFEAGWDVSTPAYLVVVFALVITACAIWAEGLLALDPVRPPAEPSSPPPLASAVIAAYLPNEAATVVETVESFLRVDYPHLQVVLAYNTPRPLPVQEALEEIARRDPRFVPLQVVGSTSKAQNVNSALARVTGEFVGVFDADHHPSPDAFARAWRWLSNGYDVVQGHCVIRNGDASWVARTVAVEFEAIYAVSHPGRARLHGFGVFGGSNGYWLTSVLRRTRMHGFMLTEDIDSSLRVVEAGGRIANDPGLISRELAPTTLGALWDQRMRWAQGWFQVSRRHLVSGWRSPRLSLRQKLGLTFLLGWREVYPWVALQTLPIIAFLAYRAGGVLKLDWLIAVFVLATLFTLSVGPGQALFAYRVAVPELRKRRRWFVSYLLGTMLVYAEWKNLIGRVAQLKEFSGERMWKVTPRAAPESPDPVAP